VTFLWAAVAALLVALLPMPYDGYVVVKWVVMVSCAVAAYQLLQGRKFAFLGWACAAIAALYNPMVPIHLSRGMWMLLDLVAAGFLIAVIRATSTAQTPKPPTVCEYTSHSTSTSADSSHDVASPITHNSLKRLTRNGGDDFARSVLRISLFGLAMLAVVIVLLKG
jgi:hypothetical protein